MKKNNNKGFTLAELLIVVAILAVLVAIAIPVFSTQLEKAREATDLANIRSAYAKAASAAAANTKNSENKDTDLTIDDDARTYTVTTAPAKSTGAFDKSDVTDIDWATLPASVTTGKAFSVTITLDADGNASAAIAQAS